jgi:hypothetical protein
VSLILAILFVRIVSWLFDVAREETSGIICFILINTITFCLFNI